MRKCTICDLGIAKTKGVRTSSVLKCQVGLTAQVLSELEKIQKVHSSQKTRYRGNLGLFGRHWQVLDILEGKKSEATRFDDLPSREIFDQSRLGRYSKARSGEWRLLKQSGTHSRKSALARPIPESCRLSSHTTMKRP